MPPADLFWCLAKFVSYLNVDGIFRDQNDASITYVQAHHSASSRVALLFGNIVPSHGILG
jgi:hypothetical protein